MFDLDRFGVLVRGGLLADRSLWDAYRAEERPWQYTASHLTLPLIVGSMTVAGLVAWWLNAGDQFGTFGMWLLVTVVSLLQFVAAVAIFTGLAGALGGRRDFDRGTAALSLAAVPAYVGNALSTLPWLGWLISLGLAVFSLVCLYRILPEFLGLPASRRVVHFVLSLVATAAVSFILAAALGIGGATERSAPPRVEQRESAAPTVAPRGGGFVGEMQRAAAIYESAMADRYAPPDDERLSRGQVKEYVRVLTRAQTMQDEYTQRMKSLAAEVENKEDAGFSDLMNVFRGAGGILSAGNAAMEVVKASGGNWAEHVWVEEQLRLAKYQPDANPAAAYNRSLYGEFAAELEALDAF